MVKNGQHVFRFQEKRDTRQYVIKKNKKQHKVDKKPYYFEKTLRENVRSQNSGPKKTGSQILGPSLGPKFWDLKHKIRSQNLGPRLSPKIWDCRIQWCSLFTSKFYVWFTRKVFVNRFYTRSIDKPLNRVEQQQYRGFSSKPQEVMFLFLAASITTTLA